MFNHVALENYNRPSPWSMPACTAPCQLIEFLQAKFFTIA
jgi:hypothetical protein